MLRNDNMNDLDYSDYVSDVYNISFIDDHTYVHDNPDVNLEGQFAKLTEWQWEHIHNFSLSGQLCLLTEWAAPKPPGL